MDPPYIDTLFNDSEYITGYFDNVELDTIYRTIAYVNGYALLDSVYYTPLTIHTLISKAHPTITPTSS